MQTRLPSLRFVVGLIAALLYAAAASAQWAWRDGAGRLVFSDQAPPKSVPEKSIVRRPQAASEPQYNAPAPAQPESGEPAKPAVAAPKPLANAAPAKTIVEREIESRRKQQEAAEAQKKSADEEKRKQQMAENCERMRGYQRALDDGMRIARVTPAGEREILDDAARAAETQRVREQIQQNCR